MKEKNQIHIDVKKEKILFSFKCLKLVLLFKLSFNKANIFFQNHIDIKIIKVGKNKNPNILKNNKIHHEIS
jgi:hypothetical protein